MMWWWNTPYSRLRKAQRVSRALGLKVERLTNELRACENRNDRLSIELETMERQVKELQLILREEKPDV